ncbi:hypothetical protein FisN_26Hh004 [Fistulifera solaris]|jgi:hypothetical protein|uniref:Uncharacterized protein n=1 Tax=Fistulifera solaris TaxID=1519565 RepID=A0A1Z5JXH8_FISSO|nr:hypothetical protein FisN_26Hh004 [Fistulifera solaris]|eukprot:GAX18714.1 hypothetical protein FisN_26Hh004 [Fistulifera solaris]
MTSFLYSSHEDQEVGSFFCQAPPEKIESTRKLNGDSFPRRPVTMSKLDSLTKPPRCQTPRLLITPYSDDVFDDENDDNISTEITEPEATPWLFRPIAPPDDSAEYDLNEHDTFQHVEEEDEMWDAFLTGIPMEIEVDPRYCIEEVDEQDNLDRMLIALHAQSQQLIDMPRRKY